MTYSLQRLLIILGLVTIPFYEILLRMLPFTKTMAPDSRIPKEMMALVFALSIGLLAVFQGTIKPFRNKFLLIIPVYLLFNLIMAPHFTLNVNNNEVGDLYFWKPFAEVLCFAFMVIAVASIEVNFDIILKTMVICGSVMAGYMILQKFGLDQFWIPKEGGEFTSVHSYLVGGNLGQPTIVSSWVLMMIPLAIYLRKWWSLIIMTIACLFTQGATVILALVLILFSYIGYTKKYLIIPILGLFIFFIFIIGSNKSIQHKVIDRLDGRWRVWGNIVEDIKDGPIKNNKNKFSITGAGLGRFSFLYPMKHPSPYQFMQAHNDHLEFIYNCGLVGEYLLLASIFFILFHSVVIITPIVFAILLSFMIVLFCSLSSFPFQLGAHQFYSAVLVGLLHNDKLIRRV